MGMFAHTLHVVADIFGLGDRKYYSQDTKPLASKLLKMSIPRTFSMCGNTIIESVMTDLNDI